MRNRHRDFFTRDGYWFVDCFTGAHLRWAASEQDNVAAALAWRRNGAKRRRCCAWSRSSGPTGSSPVTPARWTGWSGRPAPGPGAVVDRVLVRCGLAYTLRVRGEEHRRRVGGLLDAAVELAQQEGDARLFAWARAYVAQVASVEGRIAHAEDLARHSLQLVRAAGDRTSAAIMEALEPAGTASLRERVLAARTDAATFLGTHRFAALFERGAVTSRADALDIATEQVRLVYQCDRT